MVFNNFISICERTPFPLCSVIGSPVNSTVVSTGVVPVCYARSVELANTMIFQIGNAFVHFGSLILLLMMIFNVRSKYTAIGRSEMVYFFYLAIGLVISTLVVDCGVSPPSSASYPYFVAVQIGLASACCGCLLYNGMLCFQFWEDGTRLSLFLARLISGVLFAVNFIVSLATFKSWGSLGHDNTIALFAVSFILNAVILAVYVISMIILVIFALDSYWPLGAISLGVFFFVAGQIVSYVLSKRICIGSKHYVDGLFFASICNISAIMMAYKFWDMITSDDLEFSVANVENGVSMFEEDEKRGSTLFHQ